MRLYIILLKLKHKIDSKTKVFYKMNFISFIEMIIKAQIYSFADSQNDDIINYQIHESGNMILMTKTNRILASFIDVQRVFKI